MYMHVTLMGVGPIYHNHVTKLISCVREMGEADSDTKNLLNGLQKKRKSSWIPRCWYIDCFPCIKARYVLSVMTFLGFCNVYALRVNLSVAIVQMTAKHPHHNQRSIYFNCLSEYIYLSYYRSFDWTDAEQGTVTQLSRMYLRINNIQKPQGGYYQVSSMAISLHKSPEDGLQHDLEGNLCLALVYW